MLASLMTAVHLLWIVWQYLNCLKLIKNFVRSFRVEFLRQIWLLELISLPLLSPPTCCLTAIFQLVYIYLRFVQTNCLEHLCFFLIYVKSPISCPYHFLPSITGRTGATVQISKTSGGAVSVTWYLSR